MIRKLIPLIVLVAFGLVGCEKEEGPGEVEAARKATAAMPKSKADLPSEMDGKARAQASGAMEQQSAMARQMEAMNQARRKAGQ